MADRLRHHCELDWTFCAALRVALDWTYTALERQPAQAAPLPQLPREHPPSREDTALGIPEQQADHLINGR